MEVHEKTVAKVEKLKEKRRERRTPVRHKRDDL